MSVTYFFIYTSLLCTQYQWQGLLIRSRDSTTSDILVDIFVISQVFSSWSGIALLVMLLKLAIVLLGEKWWQRIQLCFKSIALIFSYYYFFLLCYMRLVLVCVHHNSAVALRTLSACVSSFTAWQVKWVCRFVCAFCSTVDCSHSAGCLESVFNTCLWADQGFQEQICKALIGMQAGNVVDFQNACQSGVRSWFSTFLLPSPVPCDLPTWLVRSDIWSDPATDHLILETSPIWTHFLLYKAPLAWR